MGAISSTLQPPEESQSVKNKKTELRKYNVPDVREKTRFEPVSLTHEINVFEATLDKYDYVIVFPKTEGPYIKFDDPIKPGERNYQTTEWKTIKDLWRQAVPGTDTKKDAAIESLFKYWKKRTGSEPVDGVNIRSNAWLTIAREAIIDTLSTKSGLQVKLTASASKIFCRIRAPIKLLEQHAAQIRYKLQLKPEIDPGSERFWNLVIRNRPIELDEERKIYSKDKANEILQNLYRAGKISATDLGVDEQVETPAAWSRRVHALERVADNVPVYNNFVAYVPFSTEKHLRYLYQTYPSVRGRTIFRAKDRLYLTKSIIDKFFDCEVLADKTRSAIPAISDIIALHDANRGEIITIELLQRRWVYFWRATAKEAGAPYVSHHAYESEEEVSWYLRLFSQPLSDIRDYFGETIGLYFAWFGFYIFSLLFPALLGILIETLIFIRGYQDTEANVDYPTIVFLFIMASWSIAFHKGWDIEEQIISLKWGTKGLKSNEKNERPQFIPDHEQPVIRSVINNRLITNFPQHKRAGRVFGTMLSVFLFIVVDLALIGSFFLLDINVLRNTGISNISWISSILIAIVIKISSFLFKPWAKLLTDYENYRSQTTYDDALVLKVVLFEVFNSYAALFYTAFIKKYIADGCYSSCLTDLRQLLVAIIIVRVSIHIFQLFIPQIQKFLLDYFSAWFVTFSQDKDRLLDTSAEDVDENNDYMFEVDRGVYDGTFDDFSYAVFQYGYLMIFIVALPSLAVIALIENLIKLRTDALNLCQFVRRPHVKLSESVGTWATLMEFMSYVGAATTVAIIVFTTDEFSEYSSSSKLIGFLITEQLMLLTKLFIHEGIFTRPEFIRDIEARQEYIDDKFFKGFEDDYDDASTSDNTLGKGTLSDNVDIDGLNLYDLRKGLPISEDDYREIQRQEGKRRELQRELQAAKDKLLEVYKSETYNESTGVGETKHGLPLGRLSVKILEVKGLVLDDALNTDSKVKIRVSIKATRKGINNAGPPMGPLNDTSIFPVQKSGINEGKVVINQSVGPFAPIRTQDADVFFDIIDTSPKLNEPSLAVCSISLRELQDQNSKDKVLQFNLRYLKKDVTADAKLLVTLKFEYSKVVPLRSRIYQIQEKVRIVERKLALMKSGRKAEDESDV